MATNAEVIATLVAAKTEVQAQTDAASGPLMLQLMAVAHRLADEIGELAVQAANESYVPATDFFKAETEEAESFLESLEDLKSALAGISAFAEAADKVIGIVSGL
jgi:hypothetical protein